MAVDANELPQARTREFLRTRLFLRAALPCVKVMLEDDPATKKRFKGVNAVCVESVFSAKMARAINDSNVITLGAMIVAPWMAKAMVDAWLDTKHTEGLDSFAGFLKDACAKVNALDTGQ